MAKQSISIPLVLLAAVVFTALQQHHSAAAAVTYNVVSYGAKGDGGTDSTVPFLKAWAAACNTAAQATVYVPPGRYFLRNVIFGDCKNTAVTFMIEATLVAPSYSDMGNVPSWITFEGVTGLTIIGGVLEGQGSDLWKCKLSGNKCPDGATTLGIHGSNNIKVQGLTSLNSQMFHIVINGCNNVLLQKVIVTAAGDSPNTDGIHVQLSRGVNIFQSRIKTGDDCVSIGPGTSDLWIEDIACGPGHGISIGSLGKGLQEEGVQNVTVKTAVITGAQNGLRIKTWGRETTGFVKSVFFRHVRMVNVQNPIVIDQNYCPWGNCPKGESGVEISDVQYEDIKGTSATEVAVKFDCSSKKPCNGLTLRDVELSFGNRPAKSYCANARGSASGVVVPANCL